MSVRLCTLRLAVVSALLGGLLASGIGAGSASAGEEEPPAESASPFDGNYCTVTCGRFKEDTCEAWDPAGEPSCQCNNQGVKAFTQCRCADGSKPTACKCSNPPNAACDPDNPPDGCGSCQCQC